MKVKWSADYDFTSWTVPTAGLCKAPSRGERFVYFPDNPPAQAYACVHWRKAKRLTRNSTPPKWGLLKVMKRHDPPHQ